MTDRTAIFAAVKAARGGSGFSEMEVAQLDDCLDRLKVPRAASAVPSRSLAPSARNIDRLADRAGVTLPCGAAR